MQPTPGIPMLLYREHNIRLIFTVVVFLFIVGFEAVGRSKGCYRRDEEGGPTERRTCGLSR
jgi:hypothetical protein